MVQAEPWGKIEQKLVRQSQNVQSSISVKHFRAEKRDEHTQVLAVYKAPSSQNGGNFVDPEKKFPVTF